ncbi:hypothetical protein F2P81_012467 [Scophthalmus maximus]|uniref:Scaffolding anchor of CK1 domain-containing protein n=1 Tax=Scophthalmus maximus TaxID=52904 RepID=A0A6A4SPQ1_SCOMX|nr:hypothetical protein F2P81_012467 [Scophthalmus maximus]
MVAPPKARLCLQRCQTQKEREQVRAPSSRTTKTHQRKDRTTKDNKAFKKGPLCCELVGLTTEEELEEEEEEPVTLETNDRTVSDREEKQLLTLKRHDKEIIVSSRRSVCFSCFHRSQSTALVLPRAASSWFAYKQMRQVIAVVMDVFTDVDLLCDLMEASNKRRIPVYVLLDEKKLGYFTDMCAALDIQNSHLSVSTMQTGVGFHHRPKNEQEKDDDMTDAASYRLPDHTDLEHFSFSTEAKGHNRASAAGGRPPNSRGRFEGINLLFFF